MRKLVVLAAVVPLLFSPAAFAADKKPERRSACPAPDLDLRYDTGTFWVAVILPVDRCARRQDHLFTLAASIVRHGPDGGRDRAQASVPCGPYSARSAGDERSDFCGLALALDHPERETGVEYDVEVTYPTAHGERTMRRSTSCTSDGQTFDCDD